MFNKDKLNYLNKKQQKYFCWQVVMLYNNIDFQIGICHFYIIT